jgi:hypothetical protein
MPIHALMREIASGAVIEIEIETVDGKGHVSP